MFHRNIRYMKTSRLDCLDRSRGGSRRELPNDRRSSNQEKPMRALYTSATGMQAQQFNLDVIANNLANVNTAGFKKSSAQFQDLLYQNMRLPGALNSTGGQVPSASQIGLGVTSGTTRPVLSQGTIQTTGGDYDVAIKGEGFIRVLLADGTTAYTRDGGLTIDGQGRLVTQDGNPVQPEIVVPADKE